MIYVMCGMIASAKSTYAKRLASFSGGIIINDDSIVTAVHGNYLLYEKELKPLYKSIENAIFSSAVILGRDIIIDRGLDITVNARARWIALAKSFDQDITCVVFKNEGAEIHAKRRFESDNRGHDYSYWLETAREHNLRWQMPTLLEGFTKIKLFEEVIY